MKFVLISCLLVASLHHIDARIGGRPFKSSLMSLSEQLNNMMPWNTVPWLYNHKEDKEHYESLHEGFRYNPPSVGSQTWSRTYPTCGGMRQSPVDIVTKDLVNTTLPTDLEFHDYWSRPEEMFITNNGHSLQLTSNWGSNAVPSISGGPLPEGDVYKFDQLHFHWAGNSARGSEHTVNGKRFPLEVHFVHHNAKYPSSAEATNHVDGLMVLGIVFQNGPCNPTMDLILAQSSEVIAKSSSEHNLQTKLNYVFPLDILNVTAFDSYVTYPGSLTTPPCLEVVQWVVSPLTIPICEKQMNQFRSLIKENGRPIENFRQVQPLNGRTINYVTME